MLEHSLKGVLKRACTQSERGDVAYKFLLPGTGIKNAYKQNNSLRVACQIYHS
jgi:hypothetical protein